jgi:hypothetical protein
VSTRIPRLPILSALAMAMLLATGLAHPGGAALAAIAPTAAPSATATAPLTPVATATVSGTATTVSSTVPLSDVQVLTATSGQTIVHMPLQVVSGGRLVAVVRTLPGAHVLMRITFADGTTVRQLHRANASGVAYFNPYIAYQPQTSTETALVTLRAVLRMQGLDDSIQGSVAVLQHIVLQGALRLPATIRAGRVLVVTVVSNQSDVSCSVRVIYPDQEVETQHGFTSARGIWVGRFPISAAVARRGFLQVDAVLSYNGVQIHRVRRVVLRA